MKKEVVEQFLADVAGLVDKIETDNDNWPEGVVIMIDTAEKGERKTGYFDVYLWDGEKFFPAGKNIFNGEKVQ